MIDVSVMIVSYNTRELTTQVLDSLRGVSGDLTIEVIVVDNASTDGSADAICQAHPWVNVARSSTNLGFARAMNLAAQQAGGRYLLLLNPDVRPDGPFIAELVEYADKFPEHGIYAGRTLREDGTDFLAGFGFPSLWSYACFATGLSTVARRSALFNPEELPGLDRSQPRPVPVVSGCLLLVDRDLWNGLGGFDPRFFMYSEDADLCLRAAQAGAQPMLVPAARVVHLGGQSSTSARKVEMLLKGKVAFVNKHWSRSRAGIGRFFLHMGVAVRAAARKEPWRSVWASRDRWREGWPAA